MDPTFLMSTAFALSVGVFIALWPISVVLRDVSIVDGWWGPGFVGAAVLIFFLHPDSEHARPLLILGLVGVWGLRLGFVLIRRRLRHGAEDSRYVAIRQSWGNSFWWKSLFIVFLLQGILQWVVGLTAFAAIYAPPVPIGPVGGIGILLAVLGLAVEAISDQQLDTFKRSSRQNDLFTGGLRKYVRFPSYSGEMLFWWGIWVIAAEAGMWWTIISPLTLTILLTKVSGAGITGAGLKKSKPEWRDYAARTPAFIPRFR